MYSGFHVLNDMSVVSAEPDQVDLLCMKSVL